MSGASALSVSPVALTHGVPAPTGRLRLLDSLVAVSATDPNGASLGTVPLTVTVVPTDAALAAVGGDVTQLVVGYLDAARGTWIALPTLLDPVGHLVAQAPQAGTLAVFRQAPTFWVAPNLDLPLTADGSGDPLGFAQAGMAVQVVATQGTAYQVQLGDGSLAWLDATQVTDVPAPDALPPLPTPPSADPPTPVPADVTSAVTDVAAQMSLPTDAVALALAESAEVEAADLSQSEAN